MPKSYIVKRRETILAGQSVCACWSGHPLFRDNVGFPIVVPNHVFDIQREKSALKPNANSEGPDQPALFMHTYQDHLCSTNLRHNIS